MKASSRTADHHSAVLKYKDGRNHVVETPWRDADLSAVAKGKPWRRFPWYLGQRNYSGVYWSATERTLVGYESRLELAHLILADFDACVKSIASQPFHLIFRSRGKKVHRTPDYLLLLESGPRVLEVKPADRLLNEEVKQLLELTRAVVESAGCAYEIAVEPDELFFANVRFLAGYRRDWLFEADLLDEIHCAAAKKACSSLADIVAEVGRPKHSVLPGIFHLMWQHRLVVDLNEVLSTASKVQVLP
jgi:hypothetical protein